MSRLTDSVDWVKDHKKTSIVAALTAAFGISTFSGLFSSERTEIYSGRIGDWNVSYEEGNGNRLIATMGGRTIVYQDNDLNTRIEPFVKTPRSLGGDKVEYIRFSDPKGTNEFTLSQIDSARFDADNLKGIFESGNTHYNALRTGIREKMRAEGSVRLEEIKDSLK